MASNNQNISTSTGTPFPVGASLSGTTTNEFGTDDYVFGSHNLFVAPNLPPPPPTDDDDDDDYYDAIAGDDDNASTTPEDESVDDDDYPHFIPLTCMTPPKENISSIGKKGFHFGASSGGSTTTTTGAIPSDEFLFVSFLFVSFLLSQSSVETAVVVAVIAFASASAFALAMGTQD